MVKAKNDKLKREVRDSAAEKALIGHGCRARGSPNGLAKGSPVKGVLKTSEPHFTEVPSCGRMTKIKTDKKSIEEGRRGGCNHLVPGVQ